MICSSSIFSKCIFALTVGTVLVYQVLRKEHVVFEKAHAPIQVKQKKTYPIKNPELFKGAGIAFTDGKLILSAYHPQSSKRYITGIGGKREYNESYVYTAFREMLEELFEYHNPPKDLIESLIAIRPPFKQSEIYSYIILSYSFEYLEFILKHIASYKIPSKLYDEFPLTMFDLIIKRKCISPSAELSHLCLLPVVRYSSKKSPINEEFMDELIKIHM